MQARQARSSTTSSLAPDIEWSSGHWVQFYERDQFLIDTVAQFVGAGLGAGEAVVLIATAAHRRRLGGTARFECFALDVKRAQMDGRYVCLDAAHSLSQFMVQGLADRARFMELIGGSIAQAAAHGSRVRAFGEMVAVLWSQGAQEAAIRLEELWNELGQESPVTLLRAYPLREFGGATDMQQLRLMPLTHKRNATDCRWLAMP